MIEQLAEMAIDDEILRAIEVSLEDIRMGWLSTLEEVRAELKNLIKRAPPRSRRHWISIPVLR